LLKLVLKAQRPWLEGRRLEGCELEEYGLEEYRLEGYRLEGYRLEGYRLEGYRLEENGHEQRKTCTAAARPPLERRLTLYLVHLARSPGKATSPIYPNV